jgi:putative sterol carrier protein
VRNVTRFTSAKAMFAMLPIAFQREHSAGLSATYHITLQGREPMQTTVIIKNKTITVIPQLEGHADITIVADSDVWLKIASRKTNPIWPTLSGKLKIKGSRSLLRSFLRCFGA